MSKNIERLLKLAADYHKFCYGSETANKANPFSDELTEEELEFAAAAAHIPPAFRGIGAEKEQKRNNKR